MMHRTTSGTATQTSLTDEQKELQGQIEKLQKQISTLEAKLRGYSTLGDLLRESKSTCEKLKEAKQELEKKLADLSFYENSNKSGSFIRSTSEGIMKEPLCKKEKIEDGKMRTICRVTCSSDIVPGAMEKVDKSALISNGVHISENNGSQQFFKISGDENFLVDTVRGPPVSSFELNLGNSNLNENKSIPRESYPVQESMTFEENEHLSRGSNTEPIRSSFHQNKASTVLSEHSDDVVHGFVHVSSKPNSLRDSLNLMQFPSVRSSNRQDSELSNENAGITRPVISSQQEQREDRCISLQLEKLVDSVNIGQDKSLTDNFSRVKGEIEILEDRAKKNKNINDTLLEANRRMEVQLKEALASENRFKEEMKRLLEKIKRLEHDRDNLPQSGSLSSQTEVVGWVDVKKEIDNKKKTIVEEVSRQTRQDAVAPDILREMERINDLNSQLLDANKKWSADWEKLQKDAERKISRHRQDAERSTKGINDLKIKHDTKISELEQSISALKQRYLEEESAKEDLKDQLCEMTKHQEKYQRRVEELEKINCKVNQEKQVLEAELRIHRTQESLCLAAAAPVYSGSGPESTQTINNVLRTQVAMFQEDFEKERQDRARAQSAKDLLASEKETLLKKNKTLEKKMKNLEREMRQAEANVNHTLHQNQTLQQENASLKNKLRMERETRAVPIVNQYYPPVIPQAGYQQNPLSPQSPTPQYVGQYNAVPVANRIPLLPTNRAQNPPELLPGAWECSSCTYVNFPTRTVCEMCGFVRDPGLANPRVPSTQQQLYTRGDAAILNNYQPHYGMSERPDDLQIDSGLMNTKT